MIPYNYHTHTSRCGHAIGTDEEYVLEAIAAGVRVLGFSDHVMLEGIEQPGIRGGFEETENYLKSIRFLREKYRDRIKILIGFEAEYAPAFVEYYQYLLSTKTIDYLILGQHYMYDKKTIIHYFGYIHEKELLLKYRDLVIEAMKTKLFKCLAHPDLFMASYETFDATARKISYDICRASLEYNVPLEINLAGYRHGLKRLGDKTRYTYPYRPFWEVVAKVGSQVIIGVDAHNPNDFRSNEYSIALKMIRELKLNHVQE